MPETPKDLVVQLKPLCTTPWDGRDDTNVDFVAVFASGRRVSFTAITPKNIMTLWQTSYPDKNALVMPGMLVVRRIDEESLWEAVNDWLRLEEIADECERNALREDDSDEDEHA